MGGQRCSWRFNHHPPRTMSRDAPAARRPRPAAQLLGFESGKIRVAFRSSSGGNNARKENQRRRRMALLGLGYAGFGSDALDDWRQFGTGLVGLQAVERGNSLLAFRMDDRKQRIVIDRAMGEGTRFFGWEVADAAALDAARGPAGTGRRPCRGRAADAGRCKARAQPDFVPRSRRQPARGILRRPKSTRRRSARDVRSRVFAPDPLASATPC